MPPIAIGVAYRIYWRHGLFFSTEHLIIFISQIILTMLGWYSHYKASTTDPGHVKSHHFRDYESKEQKFPVCQICNAQKVNLFFDPEPLSVYQMPLHVHHCSQCNKCVLGMDHHCGFTGNCVGFGNLKYFVLFLFFIAVQCASGAFLILKYSIQNGLQDYIYVSPAKSFL